MLRLIAVAFALALVVSGPAQPVAEAGAVPYGDAIYQAAGQYGTSGDWLVSTMMCESGGDPYAYNPATGDSGLFQFNPGTFYAWGGSDIWNPYEQIDLAAWAFSHGLADHWVCSGAWDGSPG